MRISLIIRVSESFVPVAAISSRFFLCTSLYTAKKSYFTLASLSEFLRISAGCNKNLKNIFDKILAKFRYCMYASNINLLLI